MNTMEKGMFNMLKRKNTFAEDIIESLEEFIDDDKEHSAARKTEVINIKALREKLNMSQQEFSKAYNIPLATVQNWEQGRRCPDKTAMAYLRAIMCYPEEIKRSQESTEEAALLQA